MILNKQPELSGRSQVIDFTKGLLVVTMVAYHTLNYYLRGYNVLYAYVGYVTQAFVFYSGFVCGSVYVERFMQDKQIVYKRLIVRGLKIIGLFLIINLIINGLFRQNYNGQPFDVFWFVHEFYSVFVAGSERISAFAILLPIGYVLLLSALIIDGRKFKYVLLGLVLLSIIAVSAFDVEPAFNLGGVFAGLAGVATGLIYNERADFFRSNGFRLSAVGLLLLFLLVLIPLGVDPRVSFVVYFLYIITVIFSVHALGGFLKPSARWAKVIAKFGQYSLFLYLVQIFFLQVLKSVYNFRLPSLRMTHLAIFALVNIVLVISCYLTEYLRSRYRRIDVAYRFFLG